VGIDLSVSSNELVNINSGFKGFFNEGQLSMSSVIPSASVSLYLD
jgi:hypothetical protein